ncbi:hypothetical protein AAY24_09205 [Sedimenticola thiotaurini]|uniref:Uncharacterized protein n=1 Tax=Sedimenticola thiotaurini TaxID=1543721 RepID=A0A0F7JYV3_9GAMM|nr:hypothetical protein AAY24_09205 [Sedimenticola thiotaurini]
MMKSTAQAALPADRQEQSIFVTGSDHPDSPSALSVHLTDDPVHQPCQRQGDDQGKIDIMGKNVPGLPAIIPFPEVQA